MLFVLILTSTLILAACTDKGEENGGLTDNEPETSETVIPPVLEPDLKFTLSETGDYYIVSEAKRNIKGKLVVPAEYNGLPVKEIAEGAFTYCKSMTEIELPDTLETISDRVFWGTGLTSITIPDSVTYIGSFAFQECAELTHVKLGKGIRELRAFVFEDCPNIKSVTLSEGVRRIDPLAFYITKEGEQETEQLKYAFERHTSMSFNAYGGCLYLGTEDNDYYYLYKFDDSTLKDVTLHENTRVLADNAFVGAQLDSVTLNKEIEYISTINCESLRAVYLYDLESYLSAEHADASLTYADTAYAMHRMNAVGEIVEEEHSLADIVIPESITRIPDRAFKGCDFIYTVTLHDKVTYVGTEAFEYCYALDKVYADEEAWYSMELGVHAFSSYDLYLNNKLVAALVIPNGIKEIGSNAFSNCVSIESVFISKDVEFIGKNAFLASAVTSVTFAMPNGWTASKEPDTAGDPVSDMNSETLASALRYGAFTSMYLKRG